MKITIDGRCQPGFQDAVRDLLYSFGHNATIRHHGEVCTIMTDTPDDAMGRVIDAVIPTRVADAKDGDSVTLPIQEFNIAWAQLFGGNVNKLGPGGGVWFDAPDGRRIELLRP